MLVSYLYNIIINTKLNNKLSNKLLSKFNNRRYLKLLLNYINKNLLLEYIRN